MTDPDLPTALMTWDQTPGDNRQRMEAVLAAVGLNRAFRTEGNLLEAEITAGLKAAAKYPPTDRLAQMTAILSAAADVRNAHALRLTKTRDWPPETCHDTNGCEEFGKCVRVVGCCERAGKVRI